MAERNTTLKMTPHEDAALSRLLGFLCGTEAAGNMTGQLTRILGAGNRDIEQIGRINAALNVDR